jgi:hypothetical protein
MVFLDLHQVHYTITKSIYYTKLVASQQYFIAFGNCICIATGDVIKLIFLEQL